MSISDSVARAECVPSASTGAGRVVVFNNMITPYTDRLYRALAAEGLDLAVLSCARQEPNRAWAETLAPSYPHQVLEAFSIRLGPGRFAHLNRGIFAALDQLSPALLVINGFYPSMALAVLWAALRHVPLALTIDGWRA